MTNQFIENLNAVCDKLGIAIDWTSDNLMPQIQDLLTRYGRYLLVSNIVFVVIGVLAIVFGAILLTKTNSSFNKGTWARDADLTSIKTHSGIGFTCLSLSIFCIALGIIILLLRIDSVVKAATIPDIYAAQRLIEMLQP